MARQKQLIQLIFLHNSSESPDYLSALRLLSILGDLMAQYYLLTITSSKLT